MKGYVPEGLDSTDDHVTISRLYVRRQLGNRRAEPTLYPQAT
jgi:hypothetical protein